MRRTAAAAALLLVAATLVVGPHPATAAVTPRLVWEHTVGQVFESSPAAADLDGDGSPDVVVGAHDSNVWALRSSDGTPTPGWPQPVGQRVNSSPALADTDGDGRPEVFVGNGTAGDPAGALDSFDHDGHLRYAFRASDKAFPAPAIHSSPAIGDLGSDGDWDVAFGSLGLQSIWSLRQDGPVNPGFPVYADDTVFSSPAIVDVDGDGRLDMVVGGDSSPGGPVDHQGGVVRAVNDEGQVLWQFFTGDIVRSSPSVGDIDGDGQPEIVFGAGDYWHSPDSRKIWALSLNGQLKPGWPVTTDGVTDGSPALADVNGDGVLDVVIGSADSAHNAGSVWAIDGHGAALPNYPRPSDGGVVIGSVVTADLDGDGAQDPIVPTGGGVFAYSGRTGARLLALNEGRVGYQNSPLVADLDGNGLLDIVVAGTLPGGQGLVSRYELGPGATLGALGWPQFRKDARHTGSWTTRPPVVPRPTTRACPPGKVPPAGFGDVPSDDPHRADIDCVVWWQVAQGTGPGTYEPARPVNRGQMATFLARLILRSGGQLPQNPPDRFPDDNGSVHEPNINALAAAGIVSGRADGTYGPFDLVSRAQMATFLVRADEYRSGRTLVATADWFPDDIHSPHQDAINKAASAGVVAGLATGIYRPDGAVARDQMASFLARELDLVVEQTGAKPPSG